MLVSKLDIDQKNSLYYEFEEGKKIVKYNNTCYNVGENMINCDKSNKELVYT